MNTEVKNQWLAALRSGEYKQSSERLRSSAHDTPSAYCCLGVLCDLHSKATGTAWDESYFAYSYLDANYLLPPAVVEWAGLYPKVRNGDIPVLVQDTDDDNAQQYATLAVLNDRGTPFTRIADLIETQL